MKDQPLSYWTGIARMGFEDDFNRLFEDLGISRADLATRVGASPAYVSKVLNGTAGNSQLSTMAKWARAVGAILQVRLVKEGKEVVRTVDYATAGVLDDESAMVSKLRRLSPDRLAELAGAVDRMLEAQEEGLAVGEFGQPRRATA